MNTTKSMSTFFRLSLDYHKIGYMYIIIQLHFSVLEVPILIIPMIIGLPNVQAAKVFCFGHIYSCHFWYSIDMVVKSAIDMVSRFKAVSNAALRVF